MKPRFEKYKVDHKITNQYTYYVTGRGQFPWDMLRYDSAWPATGDDAAKLHDSGSKIRSIRMLSYKEPTIERWFSFLWSVGTENLQRDN